MSKVRSRPEWQTVPRPRCSHQKGAVAKGSPMSRRHLQCRDCQQSRDSDERRSLMSAAGCQTGIRRCCAVHTMVRQNTQPELDSLRDAQSAKLRYNKRHWTPYCTYARQPSLWVTVTMKTLTVLLGLYCSNNSSGFSVPPSVRNMMILLHPAWMWLEFDSLYYTHTYHQPYRECQAKITNRYICSIIHSFILCMVRNNFSDFLKNTDWLILNLTKKYSIQKSVCTVVY